MGSATLNRHPASGRRQRAARSASRLITIVRTPVGMSAGLLLVAVLALAVVAPIAWSDRANATDTEQILQGPSSAHWLGTDNLGRDLLFRVLVATRLSIELALLATAIAVVIGLILGTAPALLGRRSGRVVAVVVNIAVAFPGLLMALFFAVIFGVGAKGAVLAIGFAGAPGFARLAQTLVAEIADRDYISAARLAGIGRYRLLTRHILPNIGEPLVVNATIGAGGSLLAFSGLSFLGLGVQAPRYDWGQLLGDGLGGIYVHPAAALAPGLAVVIAGLAFNLFGEAAAKGLGSTGKAGRRPKAGRANSAPAGARVPSPSASDLVLDVRDMSVTVNGSDGPVCPVRRVSFTMQKGELLGLVGDSGSGKSLTAHAIARLIEEPGRVDAERIEFLGSDIHSGSDDKHRDLLGTSLAMVFQDPMSSFNPTQRVGRQLAEVARQHQGLTRSQALARAVDRLRAVRIPAAELRATQYPHEFSGGMRQRAMIGMGVMGNPALIVADEPTTALDVTVQRQVLRLLERIRAEDEVAILLISHDVTVVGQMCDRVMVMYAGRIVEDLPARELSTGARHPYTQALVAAVPDMHTDVRTPLAVVPGRPPLPGDLSAGGCAFAPRCSRASERCAAEDPELVTDRDGHRVACWHAGPPITPGQTDRSAESFDPIEAVGERA